MTDPTAPPGGPERGGAFLGRRRWVAPAAIAAVVGIGGTGVFISLRDSATNDAGLATPASDGPQAEPSPFTSPSASPSPTEGSQVLTPEPPATWDPVPVADPVELDDPAVFTAAVLAEVTTIEAVRGVARGPGEIGGPALRLSVNLANETSTAIDLGTTVVSLYQGPARTPAVPLDGPGGRPFAGTLAPGATATGVFVFASPVDQRGSIRITVAYSPTDQTVAFEGAGPT